jgi:hypothetical protein
MRQILDILKRTYCGTFGVEFMHISDPAQKAWLQERIEGRTRKSPSPARARRHPEQAGRGRGLRKFLHVKYTGTKRFGLDGGEALIPAMEQIIKRGGQLGVKEIVLGMPHRGRLNVLANVMHKPYRAIFHEFQGGSSSPTTSRLGRREVPPRRLVRPRVRRQQGPPVADRQPLASRGGESGRAGQGARQAGPARRHRRERERARCCRSCCTATRPSPARAWWPNASACRASRPPHRRHHPFHRQQPDRLHHRAALRAPRPTAPTSPRWSRRRSSTSTATIPRRWSTPPRSRPSSARSSTSRRRHRHVLLPPLRSQRRRRADVHPAADVQGIGAHKTTVKLYAERSWKPRA